MRGFRVELAFPHAYEIRAQPEGRTVFFPREFEESRGRPRTFVNRIGDKSWSETLPADEGIEVTFVVSDGSVWTGAFATGPFGVPEGISAVYSLPSPTSALVVSGGTAYVVDVTDPDAWIEPSRMPLVEVVSVVERGVVVLANAIELVALDKDGVRWTSPSVGFDDVRVSGVEGNEIVGEVYDATASTMVPFGVDIQTGALRGGANPDDLLVPVPPLLMELYRGPSLVLGLARSGRAAALALMLQGAPVLAADIRSDLDVRDLREHGIEVTLGTDDPAILDAPDDSDLPANYVVFDIGRVIKSPGVPSTSAIVVGAKQRSIPIWSEVELGYRLLAARGTKFVGITGTNGKTTTTELLGAIFRAAGRDVAVAGNVGTPLTSIREADWVVCELSSFQLEDVHELACEVAVLLNLEPDHIDRHGSFEAYRDAKLRILERACVSVVPAGLGLDGIEFSATDELPAEPLIRGTHNRENAAAATAAARAAGIGDEHIAAALGSFPGVPHRLELVGERDGVRYVNDSKATNVAAAVRALEAYADESVHLILGGSSKGEDFAPLAAAIGANVRAVHFIGAEGERMMEQIDGHIDGTLERAVQHAARLARSGEVVLLSPACASYDQFDDFEQRGEAFRRLVTR